MSLSPPSMMERVPTRNILPQAVPKFKLYPAHICLHNKSNSATVALSKYPVQDLSTVVNWVAPQSIFLIGVRSDALGLGSIG